MRLWLRPLLFVMVCITSGAAADKPDSWSDFSKKDKKCVKPIFNNFVNIEPFCQTNFGAFLELVDKGLPKNQKYTKGKGNLKRLHEFLYSPDNDSLNLPFYEAPSQKSEKLQVFTNLLLEQFLEYKEKFTPDRVSEHLKFIALQANRVILWHLLDMQHYSLEASKALPKDNYLFAMFTRVATDTKANYPKDQEKSKDSQMLAAKMNLFVLPLYTDKTIFMERYYGDLKPVQDQKTPRKAIKTDNQFTQPRIVKNSSGLQKEITEDILKPKIEHILTCTPLAQLYPTYKQNADFLKIINQYLNSDPEKQNEDFILFFKSPDFQKWEPLILEKYGKKYDEDKIRKVCKDSHALIDQVRDLANILLTQHFCALQVLVAPKADMRYEILECLSLDHMQKTHQTVIADKEGQVLYTYYLEVAYRLLIKALEDALEGKLTKENLFGTKENIFGTKENIDG